MRQPEHLGLAEALREFQALLTSVALGHTPDREAAMTYSRLRGELLKAGPDVPIPGFVYQCASIASFRSFIGFYHPQKIARQEFIENSFARANRVFDRRPMRFSRNSDAF
jgi:hypothetical protein